MTEAALPAKSGFIPPREPLYDWGLTVAAQDDLFNDGSHPMVPAGALLAPRGTPGRIVRVGRAEENGMPVYLVEFPGGTVVGCLEEEIAPADGSRRGVPGVMD
ncbi:nitrogen fixation protein NifZ [Azospirillum thermophilum]|uniref:Nitrogen fixation protein NifZ n=1 Tax=Azospirillum thermophilum TaxID=2202148 RepID=A0A2S2CQP9_9PROT|nr:nitrogen fixation protein NifZ [Azospirillum thermophilum]AWK86779.1 nitrogen fixation protein NifZ [Azospirillum thermophilum]